MHYPEYVSINLTGRFSDGIVDPADRVSVENNLFRMLPRVRDPDTGARVLDVQDGDVLFPTDDRAPDIVIEPRGTYDLRATLADTVVETAGPRPGITAVMDCSWPRDRRSSRLAW